MPTRGRPATSRWDPLAFARETGARGSSRLPSRGGHGAGWPHGCSRPIIGPPRGATPRRSSRQASEAAGSNLDGPRLEPRAGQARQLVVFLHGYGADGNDLIGRAWQQLLPEAAFVSPHAPHPCGQAPTGREWFPLTFRDPNERWNGVNAAAPALAGFLDAEPRRGLPLPR